MSLRQFAEKEAGRSVENMLRQSIETDEQRQKPLRNCSNKLVNSNLPVEAKAAVVEARGSHRISILLVKFTTAEALRKCIFDLLDNTI